MKRSSPVRIVFLLSILILELSLLSIAEEQKIIIDEKDENYFLYGQEEDRPVIEYHSQTDKDPYHPSFIYDPSNGPRVVKFYTPWCHHCQKVANVYVAFARRLEHLTNEMGLEPVKVYGVSCKANRELCQQFKVNSFPQVHLFASGATNTTTRIVSKRLHPFVVLNRLGIQSDLFPDSKDLPKTSRLHQASGDFERTKKDLFDDAYKAFDFSMRHGIFVAQQSLDHDSRKVLRRWLELLQKTMPPGWKLRPILNEILDDFQRATSGEEHLIRILDQFDPPKDQFSPSCTKGVPGMGYTCGLWGLFHIMSVGVVKWNELVDEDTPQLTISTEYAAETLRDFIANFFACEECRTHFVADYDACALDRCHRLSADRKTTSQWLQFPVWLFETHNAVNVRLLKEAASEKGGQIPSQKEETEKRWPAHAACHKCWREDGAWNETAVFMYLRAEYWIKDSEAERIRDELGRDEAEQEPQKIKRDSGDAVEKEERALENTEAEAVSKSKVHRDDVAPNERSVPRPPPTSWIPWESKLGFLLLFGPLLIGWWRQFKRWREEQTYHHKKDDEDSFVNTYQH